MNNAEKFKQMFGFYATEMWAKSEQEFLDWINAEYVQENSWIPCSERLPEENMWTICQNNAGAMMIGKYDIEFGWMFPAYFDGIVAWMPCPAPYKESEET